jgi:hypothetical protein
MRKPQNSIIFQARRWRCGIGATKSGEVKVNRFVRAKLLVELGRLSQRFFFSLLLLYVSSCAQPPLIENSKLNEGRIHDTVRRASYASGLSVSHPLSVKLVNRTELHEILRESAAATKHSSVWAARRDGESAMGFPPADTNPLHVSAGLLSRSAAGLYIPRKQTLYVISEPARSEKGSIYLNSLGTLGDEVTLAHEVIHALQHIHYPEVFEVDEAIWQQQTDAAIALQAAVEGDANLWAAQSVGFLGRARDPEDVLELSRDSKFAPLSDAPTLARERVEFPYTYGYRFAYHERKKGLESPPASTEQVIHIKSRGRSAFLAIDLSDVSRMLDTMGCRVLFQDTMGELTLSLWLRSFNSSADQHVWDGWDGDRWIAAECENSREVAWLTSWDTEQDASEFESAVTVVAADWQRRANLRSTLLAERHGREVVVTSGGLRPEVAQMKRLAKQARVTTRTELVAHFARAKATTSLSTQAE